MGTIHITVLLDESLLIRAQDAAREMNISLDELWGLALEAYIVKHMENRRLLDKLNAAYEDGFDPEEEAVLRGMRRRMRHNAGGEWVASKE